MMPNTCFLLYATCILATTAFHFSHGRPLEPRETRNIQPEGSSLKNIIHKSSVIDPDTPGEWEIYYDESSGHPYYHNKITGMTQWENPFGRQTTDDVDPSELYESWRLYESFEFVGLFDSLTAIKRRSELPRSEQMPTTPTAEPMLEALQEIEKLAEEPVDMAQAKLEVAIFKQEQAIYGDSPIGERCREHWEKKHHSASDLVESVKSVEKDHKSPVNWILEDVTLPPTIATPQQRVVLAGAWNDLGNMWYARGEWEMSIECFRKSLFWNPEQTATLLNLASVLLKLGFENGANEIMLYYDGIHGGTMGGWSNDREQMLRNSIQEGQAIATTRNEKYKGFTDGELLLQGVSPADTFKDPVSEEQQHKLEQVTDVWVNDDSSHSKESGKALEEYVQLQRSMAIENHLTDTHGICHGSTCVSPDQNQRKTIPTENENWNRFEVFLTKVDTKTAIILLACLVLVIVVTLLPKTRG